jgi:hypothetical protein
MDAKGISSISELPELPPLPDDARAAPQSFRQRIVYGCSTWGLPVFVLVAVVTFVQVLLWNPTGRPPVLWLARHTPTSVPAVVELIAYQEPNLLVVVEEESTQSEIYLLDTRNPGHKQPIAPSQAFSETAPAWSEGGQVLAFVSNRVGGVRQVFIMTDDVITQVTGTTARLPEELSIPADTPLVWSPDGCHLALLAEGETESNHTFRELVIVATDGSRIARLTYDQAYVGSPTWVASDRLAYTLATPDGTVRVRLTNLTGTEVIDLLER